MHRNHGVIVLSVLVLAALTACEKATESGSAAPAPTSTTASVAAPAPSATAAANDEATTKACTELLKAVKKNTKDVAESEKIGPPAGYIAVSTQYIAGSTAMKAYSIGANDEVSAAADKVSAAMDDLDEAWNANPKKAPSKAELNAAVKDLETACSAA